MIFFDVIRRAAIVIGAVLLAVPASADVSAPSGELQNVASRYVAAWNASDAQALAKQYTVTGDLITPDGTRCVGHRAIAQFYSQAFAAGYKGSHSGFTVRGMRMLGARTAIMDGTWFIEGARTSTGSLRPREAGIASLVAVKVGTQWRVEALREQESATKIQP